MRTKPTTNSNEHAEAGGTKESRVYCIYRWPPVQFDLYFQVLTVGHQQQGPMTPLFCIYSAFRTHHAPCLLASFQATAGECDLRRPLVDHSASRWLPSGLLLLGGEGGSALTQLLEAARVASGRRLLGLESQFRFSQALTAKLIQKSGCQVHEIGG